MSKAHEYLAHEERCRVLAELAVNASAKEAFLTAAASWRYLQHLEEALAGRSSAADPQRRDGRPEPE